MGEGKNERKRRICERESILLQVNQANPARQVYPKRQIHLFMVSAPIKQETTTKYVDVKPKTSLNMRTKPSTNASIIIKLAKGIEVNVISEQNGWSLVKVYGKEGYVSSEYLSIVNPGSNLGTDSQDTKDNRTNDLLHLL